ncbi:MAG: hypothetical protein ACKN9K_11955, partial [Dolichospermum sp.]
LRPRQNHLPTKPEIYFFYLFATDKIFWRNWYIGEKGIIHVSGDPNSDVISHYSGLWSEYSLSL